MNDRQRAAALEHQTWWLSDLELRLNELISDRVTTDRKLHKYIVRDELSCIRRRIMDLNAFWENMPKLKELERSLAALEESDEKRARDGDPLFSDNWRHN